MAPVSPDPARDGESAVANIQAVLYVGSILTTLAVVLRIYTRLYVLKTFGPEDAVMTAAQVLTLASAVTIGLESKLGLGVHVWMTDPANNIPYMQSFYASIIVYNVATCLVKISILFQYRRIFSGKTMQLATLIGLIFESCWAITLSFLLPMVCLPVAAFWDPTVEGRCLNSLAIWYVMAGMNLVTDFIVFAMPLPVIRSLQLPTKQKIMLMFVFCIGFCTCIISIIRVRTLSVAARTDDPTWDNVDAAIWSFIELFLAVLAACLPTLKPLLVKVLPRLFRTTVSGSNRLNGNYAPGASLQSRARTYPIKSSTTGGSDSAEELCMGKLTGSPTSQRMRDDLYAVSITSGKPQRTKSKGANNGITATTMVTQKVEFPDG